MSDVQETMQAVGEALRGTDYSCKTVSWDDVQRGTVGGGLSCWGANITDTRLYEKGGRQLYTVRTDNWNEKLGKVSASELALVADGGSGALTPMTLDTFLRDVGSRRLGGYAGLEPSTDLLRKDLDGEVSIRFQTTFLPVPDQEKGAVEFAPEMYSYQTRRDDDPRNLLLLCTTQGAAVQQDGAGAKKVFHHAIDPDGKICRYWFEAERTNHKVGGAQKESKEEALEAAARGKATAAVIGTRAMGTRFNVLMTIQVPLEQQKRPEPRRLGGFALAGCKPKSLGAAAFSADAFGSVLGAEDGDGSDWDDMEEDEDCDDFACAEAFGMPPPGMPPPTACAAAACAPPMAMMQSARARGGGGGGARPKAGRANAARVSRGSMVDRWDGLAIKQPKRNPSEHVTVTVTLYNTVAGGVPSAEDVRAAVDDMEALYRACGWSGRLADAGAAFMKSELTVADAAKINAKLAEQPYVPPPGALVVGGDAFPTSAVDVSASAA